MSNLKALFVFVFISSAYGITPNFDAFDTDNGLTNISIRTIGQDHKGAIWAGTLNGLFKFDGYRFTRIKILADEQEEYIKKIFVDSTGVIWVIIDHHGMFNYKNSKWSEVDLNYQLDKNKSLNIYDVHEDSANRLWLGTNFGLIQLLDINGKYLPSSEILIQNKEKIFSIIDYRENQLILAANNAFIKYNILTKQSKKYKFEDSTDRKILKLQIVNHDDLWMAASDKLLQFDLIKDEYKNTPKLKGASIIVSLEQYKQNLFIGTASAGVFKLNLSNNKIVNFRFNKHNRNSLSEDNIYTLFMAQNGILWIGTFLSGINVLNVDSLNFEYESATNINCTNNNAFISASMGLNGKMWVVNNGDVIQLDKEFKCKLLNLKILLNNKNVSAYYIKNIQHILYIFTNVGWYSYDLIKNELKTISKINTFPKFLVYDRKNEKFYVGTYNHILYFNRGEGERKVESLDKKDTNIEYKNASINSKNEMFFGTSKGLYKINNKGKLTKFNVGINDIDENEITTIKFDASDNLIIAVKNKGLYHLNNMYKLNSRDKLDFTINGILIDKNENYWLGTNKGLGFFNNQTKKIKLFQKSEGTYNEYFYDNFTFQYNNKMYFGGKNGFISFNPSNIKIKKTPLQVTLNQFTYLNKVINVGDQQDNGFILNKAIDDYDYIEFNYKDYIIGFHFTVLNSIDPLNLKYAYRLKGLNDSWVYTDANNRQATYTNLKPGSYTFQVKAANQDGVWSEKPKELKIKVYPAPWFSPWAYAAYIIIFLFSIWSYIRYKTIASRKRAEALEKTVAERTQEVVTQKKMVESLLDHKNEVFANITHEFKTPISLILGPVDQLAESPQPQQVDKIDMIQRNAKRLMLMVGQILKLSQSEQDKEVIRESQSVQAILLMLYESFNPLAQDKNINLALHNQHDVNVYATSDCIEMVVGNLLSNALKFTNVGGEIQIKTAVNNGKVCISVTDTGSGIQAQDLDKIFKRFTRLETHKSIAGTGIGLAVVKEVTEANDGTVTVESQWGQGTTFTIEFPITEIKAVEEMSQDMVDQLVDNTENELVDLKSEPATKRSKNRITVLIIEDNLDMQTHIGNVLKTHYNCLFADRGKAGIALALKEVPDIVVCDVMMPGMDGYQVTRILRHDGRTSHIPIVLLTALNTKESRIKGWRENIDTYITKPFDATELNVQLENILNIRKLLQQKTNKAIKSNVSLNSLELPKQDLKFIEKLKDVISQLYTNEYIQKADIAAKMAVSERQLQRKVKALIDENPMDMLRDYRLEKAAMKLKDGYQVGIVSDACGFSAVSYFCSCFKKKYGVTPKKYQGLNKKS